MKKKKICRIIGLICITIFINCACTSNSNEGKEAVTNTEPQRSIQDIIQLEGHPRIFDEYSSVESFYDNINDERIALVNVEKHAQMRRELKAVEDDPIVLYLVEHSTNSAYLGTIQIKLSNSEMNLDEAVKIAVDYLPEDFLTYYKKDISYKRSVDNGTIYTYAVRQKEEQRKKGYSPYYNFKIIHYEEKNYWIIETGYAAFGDFDLGWINKNAEEWDIDLSDYQ